MIEEYHVYVDRNLAKTGASVEIHRSECASSMACALIDCATISVYAIASASFRGSVSSQSTRCGIQMINNSDAEYSA